MADKILYATGINGKPIAASAIVPGSALAGTIAKIEQEIISTGSFEVVGLISGEDPVPDVAEPKTTVIYLTQESGSSKTDPYTEWIYQYEGESSGNGHWEIIGETSIDLSGYKTKQTAVSVTGGTLKGIASFSQDANGEVTLALNDIQDGTTSQKGVVQLENSTSSTSTTTAATPAAVKAAYDLANGKQDPITFDGTYNASTNKAATESTVSDAVAALDAEVTSTDGTNVQVKVTQADGVITAVNITTDNTISAAAIEGKADKVASATAGNFAALDVHGNLTDSGHKHSDYKTQQTAVSDPAIPSTGTTTATAFIDSISQNENGVITPTKKNLPEASTSAKGIVQLAGSIGATVDSENNKAATEKAVRDAINDLDVAAVTVGASKTLASISEADGKISTSAVDIQIAESQVTNLTADLGAKADKVASATSGDFAGLDSNGNLTDSGKKASDFATADQGALAASAVQGVTMNGTDVVDGTTKIAAIPAATTPTPSGSGETTGAYGVVQITLMEI